MMNEESGRTYSIDEKSLIMQKIFSPELLLEIFSYLTAADLITIRLVCKPWRIITFLLHLNEKVVVKLCDREICGDSAIMSSGFCISNLKIVNTFGRVKLKITPTLPFWSFFGASLKTLNFSKIMFDTEVNVCRALKFCTGLVILKFQQCSGLESMIKQNSAINLKLSELAIIRCIIPGNCIAAFVALLVHSLSKFVFEPYPFRYLATDQLRKLFHHLHESLVEVNITWKSYSVRSRIESVKFDEIFNVPGLALKKVTLIYEKHFAEMLSALVTHQKDSIEELCLVDEECELDQVLQHYMSCYLPHLKKIRCEGMLKYSNSEITTRALSALRLLNDGLGDSYPSLRDISVPNLTFLSRESAIDRFAPIELCVECPLSDTLQELVLASFLHENSLHILTKLHLMDIDLSEQEMSSVIFSNCQNLVNLKLTQCNLSDMLLMDGYERTHQMIWDGHDGDLDNVVFPIMNLTRLEVLDLGDNMLTAFSVSRVIKFPHLKILNLSENQSICDYRFAQLALNNPSLQTVIFVNVNLIDDCIIEFVMNSPNLLNLDICSNPSLTDYALCILAKHEKLRWLNVQGCPMISLDGVVFVRENNRILDLDTDDLTTDDLLW